MTDKDQWLREKKMRQIGDGALCGSHVVEILDSQTLDNKAIEYCRAHDQLNVLGTEYRYLIVMPAAVTITR